MASKFKAAIYHPLLGLFLAFIIVCLEEDNRGRFKGNLVQLYGAVTRMIRDGFITLTIKFLHFFVSKSLQFRFVSIQESLSSIPSLLFWVAFTRSISSMGDDCLCNATKSL
ncbi:uncharacterized protein LOC123229821 [Mangifera indica]|uniref:uncharacterized protein LOC123229821 n=1 Tax=Mangifera indica TaxID=29780 RepID=UPI001CFAA368|nr:uncharacterized protein LOC123229821 [Mangifera indica]